MKSNEASSSPRPLPWFRAVDYPDILEVMIDRDDLPREFEDWEYAATSELDRLTRDGVPFFKAYISPFSFLRWCRQNGHVPDQGGRNAFVAYLAAALTDAKLPRGAGREAEATRARRLSMTKI